VICFSPEPEKKRNKNQDFFLKIEEKLQIFHVQKEIMDLALIPLLKIKKIR
jgi:hypothetical protein